MRCHSKVLKEQQAEISSFRNPHATEDAKDTCCTPGSELLASQQETQGQWPAAYNNLASNGKCLGCPGNAQRKMNV